MTDARGDGHIHRQDQKDINAIEVEELKNIIKQRRIPIRNRMGIRLYLFRCISQD